MLTTVDIVPAIAEFYNRTLLDRYMGENVYGRFAVMKPMPTGHGSVAKFRGYDSIDDDDEDDPILQPGEPGNAVGITYHEVTCPVYTYGKHAEYEEEVTWKNIDPIVTEITQLLGENMGKRLDYLRRDVLITGTSVQYANGASRAALNTELTPVQLEMAIRRLKTNNAKKLTKMAAGTVQVGTVPIAPGYICIVHPHTTAQLKRMANFTKVKDYPSSVTPLENEVGAYDEIRFIETSNAKIIKNAGAAIGADGMFSDAGVNNDVYVSVVLARGAYGIVDVRGKNARIIAKALGSSGAADPYDQVGTIAWKATTGTCILDDNLMDRLEHCNFTTLEQYA